MTGSDSSFSQNTSDLGGAFYARYSQASAIIDFETCVFEENTALTHGGALYNQASDTFGSLNITNSLFAKNSAGQNGGGLYSTGEVGDVILNLLNCTLAQNSADFGGALFALDSFSGTVGSTAVSLEHCTIAQNIATSAGGGLFAQALDEGNLLLELNNTILASNTAPLGPDLREDSEANATIEVDLLGSNIFSSVAGSSLSESASGLFLSQNPVAPLGNYGGPTRTLHPLSEASLSLPEITRTDQRGFTLTGPLTPGAVQTGPVIIVDNLGDDITTETTLRRAIADAANQQGAIIQFDPSLAGQTILLTEGQIIARDYDALFIDGTGLDITIQLGETPFTTAALSLRGEEDVTATVQGLTFAGQGGLDVSSTMATMNHCRFTQNQTGFGIGSSDDTGDAQAVLNHCEISFNSVEGVSAGSARSVTILEINDCDIHNNNFFNSGGFSGGGGISASGGDGNTLVTVNRSTVTHNTALRGGGLYVDGASIILNDSTVSHNTAETDGGGAYLSADDSGASLTLNRSTISNNFASRRGGAVCAPNSFGGYGLTLNQSTVAENTADEGGAFFFRFGEGGSRVRLTLEDSTVSSNTALTRGGGLAFIHVFPETTFPQDDQFLNFENSILAGNSSPFSPDILLIASSPSTIIETFTGFTLFSSLEGSDLSEDDEEILLVADPLLSPLGNFGGPTETIIPLPGSLAIDCAITSTATSDQRGFIRPLNGDNIEGAIADLGSVEAPNYANPGPDDFLSIWLTDQDGDGSPWGLEQAIGTDPAVADPENAANLSIPVINAAGNATLSFGQNADALAGTSLALTRSTTLQPADFVTLFTSSLDDSTSVDFLDNNPPSPRAFYRLEATYNP